MPLRDHFLSPVNDRHRRDAVHGQWPAEIARHLFDLLPPGYQAEPKIHHSASFEEGGRTVCTVPTDLTELDEYEICVYDADCGRIPCPSLQ